MGRRGSARRRRRRRRFEATAIEESRAPRWENQFR